MQRHPLSQDFRWAAHPGPFNTLSDEQARQYDELGYFLFERAFDPREIQAVMAAIDPLEAEHERWLRDTHDGQLLIARADAITFTVHLVTRSDVLRKFSTHTVFQNLCHDTLGPGARLYWDQAVYKKPGNPEEFPWHQDNGYTFVEPQQYLTCWVALTDATVENGCPWVAPHRHRMGTLEHTYDGNGLRCLDEVNDAVPVPAKSGDIVVFSSLTPHRTGPNLTEEVRKSYILQYAPDGAVVHTRDGRLEQANDPERQYPVTESAPR